MSLAADPGVLTQEQTDAFAAQVLRYLEVQCSTDELAALQDQLMASAAHRELFVQTARMFGYLHESYAARRAEWQSRSAGAAAPADGSDVLPVDPGAETVVQELSPDDTVNPAPQPRSEQG